MANLHVGTDVIEIKDAVRKIRQNIRELQSKKAQVNENGYAAANIVSFYENKIAAQRIALIWLRKAL